MRDTIRRTAVVAAAVTVTAGTIVLGAGSASANGSYLCHSGPAGAVCAEVIEPSAYRVQGRLGIKTPGNHTICGVRVELHVVSKGNPHVLTNRDQRCVTGAHVDMLTPSEPSECLPAVYYAVVVYRVDGSAERSFTSKDWSRYCY